MFSGRKTLSAAFMTALTIAIFRHCGRNPSPKSPEPPVLTEARDAFTAYQRSNPADASARAAADMRLQGAEQAVRQWIKDAEARKDAAALADMRLYLERDAKTYAAEGSSEGPNGQIAAVLRALQGESAEASKRLR